MPLLSRIHAILFVGSRPRLLVPGLVVVLVSFAVAYAVMLSTRRVPSDEERAAILANTGRAAAAEAIYAQLLRERPTVSLAIALVEEHEKARLLSKVKSVTEAERTGLPDPDPPLPEETIDAILATLPEDLALPALFWRGVMTKSVPAELRAKVEEGAKAEPPIAFANRLLGREAFYEHDLSKAANHLEREGLAFPERSSDVDAALQIWITLGAWEAVHERLADPRIAAAAEAHTKYRAAVHTGDWKSAAKWLVLAWKPRITAFGLSMSATCTLAWAFFCARLGKAGERPRRRVPLYLAAFVLGIASVIPTAAIIAIEEAKLRLVETGDVARDLLFFVFGVGLREEASKLLLFAPLLFVLRKLKADKLDVLVCGGFVGLGFATEENLGYLAKSDLHQALGRFLTANFFHIAATGVLATALDDFVDDRERHARDFTRITLLVVGIHGAYDFLLSHPEMGGSFVAMGVFIFLARMFLGAVDVARRRVDRGISVLHAFVFAVAIVVGVSFAHAILTVGFGASFLLMAEGLLGLAIMVFVFVRTLRDM